MEETKKKFELSLPIAIVIAGVLIAGAIVLAKRTPASVAVTDAPLDQALATAEAAGVKTNSLKSCIEDREMEARVNRDLENGKQLGINGTPYNVVIGPNNNRFAVPGAFPPEFFTKVIEIMKAGTPRSAKTFDAADVENVYNTVMNEGVLPTITNDTTALMLPVDPAVDHVRGNANGSVMIVEYSDFECPYCQVHHETMKQLIANDPDLGWAYRQYPLSSIHKGAQLKAEASECVATAKGNDAFWAFADKNFETLGE